MNGFRLFLWVIGCGLVVGGLAYVYQNTRLADDIPLYVAVAGLAVIVGLMFMGLADRVGKSKTVVVERLQDPTVVKTLGGEATVVRTGRPIPARTVVVTPPPQVGVPVAPSPGPLAQANTSGVNAGWTESKVHTEQTIEAGPDGRQVTQERKEWHRRRRVAGTGGTASGTHRRKRVVRRVGP